MTPNDPTTTPYVAPQTEPVSADLQYFGVAAILSDTTVSSCEHIYKIEFTMSDSNGQSAIYKGHVITYQAFIDGPMLSAFVGPGGKADVTVDEHFTPDGPDCTSHLQPHVRNLDDEGVFG